MGEIGLGQFIKNVFDYSTGKMPTQQPGRTANENFQHAHKEALKQLNQTMQNITQNFVQQQNIMQTQMQLKEFSNIERAILLKNLLNMPEDMQDLVKMLASDGKPISEKDLKSLMNKNLDISKLIVLLQNNGKEGLSKITKMITTMNQSGIFDTHQLKEMQVLINACIPANDASAAQVLKNLMVMYLPWLPINEAAALNGASGESENEKKKSGDDMMTIVITTKNYGIIKIILYKDDSVFNVDLSCNDKFPKDTFGEMIASDTATLGVNPEVTYTTRRSTDNEKSDELKVEFSKTSSVSPKLLFLIHAVIKIVSEIDNKGTLNETRRNAL